MDNEHSNPEDQKKVSFADYLKAADPKPGGMYGTWALYLKFIRKIANSQKTKEIEK